MFVSTKCLCTVDDNVNLVKFVVFCNLLFSARFCCFKLYRMDPNGILQKL